MQRVTKFLALPLPRKLLVLKCWWLLNATAVALRLFPLSTLLRIFGTNQAIPARSLSVSQDDILWSIRAAAPISWKPTCAVRGLVAERLLRQAGIAAMFKVGVSRKDEDFQAHAWVEGSEGILIGASPERYHLLPDLAARDLATRP